MLNNPMRDKWTSGDTAIGGWMTTSNFLAAQTMAGAAFDYVCLDLQHGALDYGDVPAMLGAVELEGCSAITRVPWNEPGIIGKVLDAGSVGVIIPMVNTVAQCESAVRSCLYAPAGTRSYGPVRAGIAHGAEYYKDANANISVIPMIETVEALANVDAILAVPGVTACYVGPADLSITLGLPPGNNDDEPVFMEALATIVAAANNAGVVAGCHTSSGLVSKRREMGFRMITVTSDLVALKAGISSELASARGSADAADGGMY